MNRTNLIEYNKGKTYIRTRRKYTKKVHKCAVRIKKGHKAAKITALKAIYMSAYKSQAATTIRWIIQSQYIDTSL